MKSSILLTALLTAAALLLAALAGAALVVYGGVYDVRATRQHTQWVYSLLDTALHQSVRRQARDIHPPPLDDAARIQRGAACFQAKCVQCHGAPGVAPDDIGKSMQPVPGPLVDALQRWRPREIYWITRYGIKMSGMPAWEFRLQDSEMWDIAAFVNHMPELTPQAYADLTQASAALPAVWQGVAGTGGGADLSLAGCGQVMASRPVATDTSATFSVPVPTGVAQGSIERGRQALHQYACNACHTIPGLTGSFANVGPPLQGLARRSLIAGRLVNTPQNLALWLQHPKSVKPLTAMPDMGVTDAHAADMVAYLATLQ